jgi:hypothetical protein
VQHFPRTIEEGVQLGYVEILGGGEIESLPLLIEDGLLDDKIKFTQAGNEALDALIASCEVNNGQEKDQACENCPCHQTSDANAQIIELENQKGETQNATD